MSLPRPLDQMREEARRDDWDMSYVGSDIRQLIGEIDRLQAIVDNVLSTADGVLIYPGCGIESVWSNPAYACSEPYKLGLHLLDYDSSEDTSEVFIQDSNGYSDFIEKCYSTREAAAASKHPAT